MTRWLAILLAIAGALSPPRLTLAEPLKVIFDTDIDGDNDDVAAAAILHAYADAGQVEILAMGVVSLHPYSPACLDAINTYYGRGDIPIGVYKGTNLARQGSPYAKVVAERCPHDIGLSEKVPNVLGVYRRILSSQPDGKVTIIAVGQMNNLVDLLASPPDEHSDLPGRELVRRKVAVLFVMGPYFNETNGFQRAYNFTTSPKAAVNLTENWPTKIKFGEGNLGHRHFIGSRLGETPTNNPARIAFEAYFAGKAESKRHCADPATVLYAMSGTQYFGEAGPGACDVRDDGFTRWNSRRDKQHFYNTQKLPVWELEEFMEKLLVKPPSQRARGPAANPVVADSFRFTNITDKSLALFEGTRPVLVYNYGVIQQPATVPVDRARGTYVHPIYGLDGEVLTDDFPKDHYAHRGLFWGWPHIRIGTQHYDLWDLRGIEQRFERWLARDASASAAMLGAQNGWYVGDRKVVQEEVWLRATPSAKDERVLDVELKWTPIGEPLTLQGAEGKSYGGLTFRFAPRTNTVITTRLGQGEKDLLITRLPWADFSARFNGPAEASGASIMVAPDHPAFPPEWMTRHYGLLCVGWPGVQPKTFQPGETIRCRYRVWIHRGAGTVESVSQAYRAYEQSLRQTSEEK